MKITKWFTSDEVWEVVIMSVAAAMFLLLYEIAVDAAEIEPMAKLMHGSDIARGGPFNNKDEPQYDSLTAGVTITAGSRQRWEIDLTQGIKWVDRGPRESATEFSVTYYPRRNR